MLKNSYINTLDLGERIYFFRREGVIPVTCGLFEYFNLNDDNFCISANVYSIKVANYLYDSVDTSLSYKFGSTSILEQVCQLNMQFSGAKHNESKA